MLSKGGTIMILNMLRIVNTVAVNLRVYMIIFFQVFLAYTEVKGKTIRRFKVLKYIGTFLTIIFSYNMVFMFFTRTFTLGKISAIFGYSILVAFWVGITKYINISIKHLKHCQEKKNDDNIIDVDYKEL